MSFLISSIGFCETTYYVDSDNGDDANTGTEEHAYLSIFVTGSKRCLGCRHGRGVRQAALRRSGGGMKLGELLLKYRAARPEPTLDFRQQIRQRKAFQAFR